MKVKRILKKLNYLPRWAWYLASLSIGGPIGPLFVYLGFHVLDKMAKDEEEDEAQGAFDWDVDIDRSGVHVRSRSAGRQSAPGVYRDADCVVTDESDEAVRSEWSRTESSARRASERSQARSASPDKPQAETAEGGDIEDVTREVDEAIRRIRRANDLIPDPELSAQIESIENSCNQILSILRQRPQLLTELRTFLRYYLPTTLKLLDARVRLDKNANTPKAREVRQRISEALGVIDKAFLKQVEALDEYRFIDLESEMDVLRDMLRADGLADEEKEEDPFASVMSERASGKGGTPLAGH